MKEQVWFFQKKFVNIFVLLIIKNIYLKNPDDIVISNIIKEKYKIFPIMKRCEKFINEKMLF